MYWRWQHTQSQPGVHVREKRHRLLVPHFSFHILLLPIEFLRTPSTRYRAPTDPCHVWGLVYGREGQISKTIQTVQCWTRLEICLPHVLRYPNVTILLHWYIYWYGNTAASGIDTWKASPMYVASRKCGLSWCWVTVVCFYAFSAGHS